MFTRLRARGAGAAPEPASTDRTTRTTHIPLAQADAERLPFVSGSFDRVLCVVVLPYVREELALREAARVLRPGGRLVLTAHGAGYYLGLVLGRDMTLKRRLFGAVSLAGTFTARAGVRLPGARFQTIGRLAKTLSGSGARVVHASTSRGRLGFAEGIRLVAIKGHRQEQRQQEGEA